jgi:hypothetical protein
MGICLSDKYRVASGCVLAKAVPPVIGKYQQLRDFVLFLLSTWQVKWVTLCLTVIKGLRPTKRPCYGQNVYALLQKKIYVET